ncbi:MAG: hypothetical protein ACHP7P_13640, partial [Terriglobales bacterium]
GIGWGWGGYWSPYWYDPYWYDPYWAWPYSSGYPTGYYDYGGTYGSAQAPSGSSIDNSAGTYLAPSTPASQPSESLPNTSLATGDVAEPERNSAGATSGPSAGNPGLVQADRKQ